MDGKLTLVANFPASPPTQSVARFKALANIERGFQVLKSEIEFVPVFHRLRLHPGACTDLPSGTAALSGTAPAPAGEGQPSPERAGDRRRIQYHQATLHQRQPASRVSAITPQQEDLGETVALPEPSARHL